MNPNADSEPQCNGGEPCGCGQCCPYLCISYDVQVHLRAVLFASEAAVLATARVLLRSRVENGSPKIVFSTLTFAEIPTL